MENIMPNFITSIFKVRHNRFVCTVEIGGKPEKVHVPNTGRLSELLLPGTPVELVPSPGKYRYKILHVLRQERPVMIDSVKSNAVFHDLLRRGKVPGMETCRVIRREPALGRHRFDYELSGPAGPFYAELKSCTLFHGRTASFPDAVSLRASEHVRLLAGTGNGMLVFFLLGEGVTRFLPNYHTDFHFYRALMECRHSVDIRAYSAVYDENRAITGCTPVEVLYPQAEPVGSYLIVLRNARRQSVTVGKLGTIDFPGGYYAYAGSGMGGLFQRIARHRRAGKRPFWHIDYITPGMKVLADIPIVGNERLECALAEDCAALGGAGIGGFGSSDCRCGSHLFFFTENPLLKRELWDMVLERRFGTYS